MRSHMMFAAPIAMAADSQAATYRIRSAGLNCNFCAFTIERLIGKVAGVEKRFIDVDVNTGLIEVESKAGAFADPKALRQAVEKGGYTFKGMEASIVGRFVSASGSLRFRPDGAKEALALQGIPKDAKVGILIGLHATVEISEKGEVTLKAEHFAPPKAK